MNVIMNCRDSEYWTEVSLTLKWESNVLKNYSKITEIPFPYTYINLPKHFWEEEFCIIGFHVTMIMTIFRNQS
jgi:hypothetical protein